jgi:ATP-dependent DNA ligase
MVITRGGAPYQPDKRPSKDCQKVKKELADNIDCFFTGRATAPTREYTGKEIETWKYWQDIRTGAKMEGLLFKDYKDGATIEPITKPYFHGWAGSLEIGVLKDGKVYPIGFLSGLEDAIKADPGAQRMKCIEVAAMEILETGGIRHGKLMRFRPDLTPNDCTYEKYMKAE